MEVGSSHAIDDNNLTLQDDDRPHGLERPATAGQHESDAPDMLRPRISIRISLEALKADVETKGVYVCEC